MTFDPPTASRAHLQWMSPDRLDRLHPALTADLPLGQHWGPSYQQQVHFRPVTGRDQGLLLAHDPLWNESAILCEHISFDTAQGAIDTARTNLGHHGVSVDDLALLARRYARRTPALGSDDLQLSPGL